MTSDDDDTRFEDRIRDGLATRDPGPATERLRRRVSAVTVAAPVRGARIRRFVGVVRPAVAATLTLAAVLVGILIVSIVRPPGTATVGPGSSGQPGGTLPGPDLATVGAPLGLSIGWTVLGVLFALLVAWAAVELYVGMPSGARSTPGRFRTQRARGLLVVILAVPILVLGQVIRTDASLAPGGFFEASLVHLEGMGTILSATGQRDQAAYFRYVPSGTVTFVQSVRNDGRLPITVTGVTGADMGFELRLWAAHDPSGPLDVDTMPNYPFAPFQLTPGAEREIVVIVHFAPCPGIDVPSPEPSPDLSGDYVPAAPFSTENFSSLGLTYSVLGFAREVEVPLFATVAARSPTTFICGTDPAWTIPAPFIVMP